MLPKLRKGLRKILSYCQRIMWGSSILLEITTFIFDQHMDILFITETWLDTHGDEGKLHDLTSAGYIAKSFPRES